MIERKERGGGGYVPFAEKAGLRARSEIQNGVRYQSNSKLTRLSNLKWREQVHLGHFLFVSPQSFIIKYTRFPESGMLLSLVERKTEKNRV